MPLIVILFSRCFSYFTFYFSCSSATSSFSLFVLVIVSQFFLLCPSFAMLTPRIICLGQKQRGKKYFGNVKLVSLSHWPRGLKRRSAAARLLRLWIRIPPGAWMFFCCECCVLSGRGLRDGLITHPEESY